MSGKLQDRVAIVTGSSSGNGRAIALALAAEGATVVCSDLRREAIHRGIKRDYMFRGTIDLASIRIWLRDPVP